MVVIWNTGASVVGVSHGDVNYVMLMTFDGMDVLSANRLEVFRGYGSSVLSVILSPLFS